MKKKLSLINLDIVNALHIKNPESGYNSLENILIDHYDLQFCSDFNTDTPKATEFIKWKESNGTNVTQIPSSNIFMVKIPSIQYTSVTDYLTKSGNVYIKDPYLIYKMS